MSFKVKHQPSELETLLATPDAKEQAEQVRKLLQPVVTLAIQLDMRTGQFALSNIGPVIPIALAYQMLEAARQSLIEQERKVAQGAKVEEAPPAVKS